MFFDDPFTSRGKKSFLQDFTAAHSNASSSSDFVEFERFSEFEDDSKSIEFTSQNQNTQEVVSKEYMQPVNHLVMFSLLEHICSLYARDEQTSEILFKVLCGKLRNMMFIPQMLYLDDFKAVRMKYQTAFKDLMRGSLEFVQKEGVNSLDPEKKWHVSIRTSFPSQNVSNSWYSEMFYEEVQIGKGGFGRVVKARNKLDQKSYAIKKVELREIETAQCFKTLREVQIFSQLEHQNIVRYHSSWLEWGIHHAQYKGPTEDSNEQSTVSEDNGGEACCTPGDIKDVVAVRRSPYPLPGNFGIDVRKFSGEKKEHCGRAFRRSVSLTFGEVNSTPPQCRSFESGSNISKDLNMTLFIQMELCNRTLLQWMDERNQNVSHTDFINKTINDDIFKQVLTGVGYLHEQGLMHRDLKPANIFLKHEEERLEDKQRTIVKVGDFGLSRSASNSSSTPNTPIEENSITVNWFSYVHDTRMKNEKATVGVGTTTYAAPEQIGNSQYTNKVDVYSLGIIYFEMYRPFNSQMERAKTILEIQRGNICSQVKEKWTKESSLISQMISKDPKERPTAKQILESHFVDDNTTVELEYIINSLRKRVASLEGELAQKTCINCKRKMSEI